MPRRKKLPESARRFLIQPEDFDPAEYPGPIAENPLVARMILAVMHFRSHCKRTWPDKMVPLSSTVLGEIIGRTNNMKAVREAMEAAELIVVGPYLKDRYCRGYRPGERVLFDESGNEVVWDEYDLQAGRMTRQYERFIRNANKKQNHWHPAHNHLTSWANRVEIDFDRAVASLPAIEDGMSRKQARDNLRYLRQGFWHRKVCPYNRYHSNFTNFHKSLRVCLSFDGEPLVGVDIKNSQPVFLTAWLAERDDRAGTGPDPTPRDQSPGRGDHMLSKRNIEEFARVVSEGRLYETFMAEIGPEADRDRVKSQSMAVMYGEPDHMESSLTGKAFKKLFPVVHAAMKEFKTPGFGDDHKNHYKELARELQRRESAVVITGICERLRVEYSYVPVLTIHDSVLTTERHLPTVERVMVEAFAEFKAKPSFRIEAA